MVFLVARLLLVLGGLAHRAIAGGGDRVPVLGLPMLVDGLAGVEALGARQVAM
jgi:predicted polyphosphate/ATP-dependent NAD kinase